jgi:hypothetical protein
MQQRQCGRARCRSDDRGADSVANVDAAHALGFEGGRMTTRGGWLGASPSATKTVWLVWWTTTPCRADPIADRHKLTFRARQLFSSRVVTCCGKFVGCRADCIYLDKDSGFGHGMPRGSDARREVSSGWVYNKRTHASLAAQGLYVIVHRSCWRDVMARIVIISSCVLCADMCATKGQQRAVRKKCTFLRPLAGIFSFCAVLMMSS